jgi:hypothetical protein
MNRENLEYLRDVVIPYMEANPEQVDFNSFECGTRRCLFGWYVHLRYEVPDFYRWLELEQKSVPLAIRSEFGDFSENQMDILFGDDIYGGSLEDRKQALRGLLR